MEILKEIFSLVNLNVEQILLLITATVLLVEFITDLYVYIWYTGTPKGIRSLMKWLILLLIAEMLLPKIIENSEQALDIYKLFCVVINCIIKAVLKIIKGRDQRDEKKAAEAEEMKAKKQLKRRLKSQRYRKKF